jgi:hypothetical protein
VLHLIDDSIARPTPDIQQPAHDIPIFGLRRRRSDEQEKSEV